MTRVCIQAWLGPGAQTTLPGPTLHLSALFSSELASFSDKHSPRKSLIAPHFPGITLADGRKSLYLLSFSKRPRMKSHWLALGPVSAAEPISRARVMQYSDWPHWGHVFPLKLKVLIIFFKKGIAEFEAEE